MRFFKIAVPATLAVLLTATVPAVAQGAGCTGTPSATRLIVNIDGVRPGGGLIAVSLYADVRGKFLAKRGALYVGRAAATSPRTRMCIHLPNTGVWALAVYHDANANRSFDRTGVGLPAEGFGFTNNPSTMFGIPAFSTVRLNVPRNNMATTVRLKYPE